MTVKTFTGADNNGAWSDAANWNTNSVPSAGDVAVINSFNVTATNVNFTGVTIDLNTVRAPSIATLNVTGNLGYGSDLVMNGQAFPATANLTNSTMHGLVDAVFGLDFLNTHGIVTNDGAIVTAGTSSAAIQLDVQDGSFINNALIAADTNSQITLNFASSDVTNNGLILAGTGSNVTLTPTGQTSLFTNNGLVLDAGTLTSSAGIHQSGHGVVAIADGGVFDLNAAIGGGLVLDSGTLAFGTSVTGASDAELFASALAFGRDGAELTFGTLPVQETYDAGVLKVSDGSGNPVASLQLAGRYSAADFSVQGSAVVFNSHHAIS